tara:strand:- start:2625 stop:3440 length:816 start_codon:yes stop_codon:yes gene_type:complete
MKVSELFEDIYVPDGITPRKSSSGEIVWSLADKKVLSDPELTNRMRKMFPLLVGNLNVIVLDTFFDVYDDSVYDVSGFALEGSTLHTLFKEYHSLDVLLNARKLLQKNMVNVILTENVADQWVPLSPWMIVHRCCHALLNGGSWFSNLAESLFPMVQALDLAYYGPNDVNDEGTCRSFVSDYLLTFLKFIDIRSFNEGNIKRDGEVVIECMVQHAKYGHLKMKELPPVWNTEKIIPEYRHEAQQLLEQANKLFSEQCETLWGTRKGSVVIL